MRMTGTLSRSSFSVFVKHSCNKSSEAALVSSTGCRHSACVGMMERRLSEINWVKEAELLQLRAAVTAGLEKFEIALLTDAGTAGPTGRCYITGGCSSQAAMHSMVSAVRRMQQHQMSKLSRPTGSIIMHAYVERSHGVAHMPHVYSVLQSKVADR